MANRIDELRKLAGFTVEELANKAGISRNYLHELKTGKKRLNTDVMDRLSKALDVSSADLLNSPSRKHVMVVGSIGHSGIVEYYGEKNMRREAVYLPAGFNENDIQKIEIKTDILPDPYFTYDYALVYADRHCDPQRVANAAIKIPCIVTTADGISQPVRIFPGTKPGKYHIQKLDNNIAQDVQIIACQIIHSWVLKTLA